MTILDLNLGDAAQVADPRFLPALEALRSAEPVYWSAAMNGWIITGYDEVAAAYKDRRISNDRVPAFAFSAIPQEEWPIVIPNLWRGVENWVVNMDSPRHSRVRSLLMKAFTPKFVESLGPLIEQLCHEAVEEAQRLGSFDFMAEIAFPVPAKIILTIFGIPHSYLDQLREWNHRVSLTVQTFATREILIDGDLAIAELNDAICVEIEKRNDAPADEFLSRLIEASGESGRLNMEEVLSVCQALLFAGQDTTVNSICLGLLAFIQHPDQAELFLSGAVDPMLAMNEVTRYTAMSASMFKVAKEDFTLGGKKVRAGDVIFIMTAAANHDPAIFKNPEKFDLCRANLNMVQSFAPGIHMCIGHYLARVEMAAFFKAFLTRFKTVEIMDSPVKFQPNFVFRGLEHLNVRVSDAAAAPDVVLA